MDLILYTRTQCPLCRQAEALLNEAGMASAYREQDVDLDLDLLRRYGDKVPVVMNEDTGETLKWPFTASQVRRLAEME